jgi:hypothetical protein
VYTAVETFLFDTDVPEMTLGLANFKFLFITSAYSLESKEDSTLGLWQSDDEYEIYLRVILRPETAAKAKSAMAGGF